MLSKTNTLQIPSSVAHMGSAIVVSFLCIFGKLVVCCILGKMCGPIPADPELYPRGIFRFGAFVFWIIRGVCIFQKSVQNPMAPDPELCHMGSVILFVVWKTCGLVHCCEKSKNLELSKQKLQSKARMSASDFNINTFPNKMLTKPQLVLKYILN